MTPKELRTAVRGQFRAGVDTLASVATETELILGGEYLIDRLNDPASDGRYRAAAERQVATAFRAARRRARTTRSRTRPGTVATTPVDAALGRTFAGIATGPDRGGRRAPASVRSVASVADLRALADATQRRFDGLVALAPHTDDEFLPPDGSGEPPVPGPGDSPGTGGGTDFTPPGPDSFESYPADIQTQAQDRFDEDVQPGASGAVDAAREDVDRIIREGQAGGLAAVQAGISSTLGNVNATIAGIVAGAAATIGGPVGAGLAALALLLIPKMLAEFEELVQETLKSIFG